MELREIFLDRVIEAELSLVDEHQRCDGRDRLRHRGDAEDRAALHRQVAADVLLPERLVVDDAVLGDQQRYRACDVAPIDRLLDERRQRRRQYERHEQRGHVGSTLSQRAAALSRTPSSWTRASECLRRPSPWQGAIQIRNYAHDSGDSVENRRQHRGISIPRTRAAYAL